MCDDHCAHSKEYEHADSFNCVAALEGKISKEKIPEGKDKKISKNVFLLAVLL